MSSTQTSRPSSIAMPASSNPHMDQKHNQEQDSQPPNDDDPWIRWTPWLGITSILTIFLCAAASGAILGVSHEDLVEDWKIKPAVLLAILSATSNIAFSTALATGVAVRFWLHATQGALLTQLHYIWDHGRGIGFIHAFRAGSEARRVAIIATLGYIVQFSTGPILQRATYQVAQDHLQQHTMYLDISSRIPDGHFGVIDVNGRVVAGRRAMSQARDWYRNATITTKLEAGYTCPSGVCTGEVEAAGFIHTCTRLPDREIPLLDNSTDGESVFLIYPIWTETVTEDGRKVPQINLTTTHSSSLSEGCMSLLKSTHCTITSATILYPIQVENSTISLRYSDLLPSSSQASSNTTHITSLSTPPGREIRPYTSPGDSLTAEPGTLGGPLIGLFNFLDGWLGENSTKTYTPVVNKTLYSSEGCISDTFFRTDPWDYTANNPFSQCGLLWDDPTSYVLRAMYDFMFRVALKTGSQGGVVEGLDLDPQQVANSGSGRKEFPVVKITSELIFRSDERYLIASLIATGICLGLMGSLIWGWWRLEKKVTLSPLETARAFGDLDNDGRDDGGRKGRGRGTIEDILEAVKGVEIKVPGQRDRDREGVTQVVRLNDGTGDGGVAKRVGLFGRKGMGESTIELTCRPPGAGHSGDNSGVAGGDTEIRQIVTHRHNL